MACLAFLVMGTGLLAMDAPQDSKRQKQNLIRAAMRAAQERNFEELKRLDGEAGRLIGNESECIEIAEELQALDKSLLNAVADENWSEVDRLIAQGADIDANSGLLGTSLCRAAIEGHNEICMRLIGRNANVNYHTKYNFSPLMWAARKDQYSTCQLLIDYDADVNLEKEDGDSALRMVAASGFEQVTQLLIDNGAHVNAKNHENWTVLMHTARNGRPNTLKLLLDNGVNNINTQNIHGSTALIVVARDSDDNPMGHSRSLALAQLLIDNKANLFIKDKEDMDALAKAAANNHLEMCELLIRAMVKLTKPQMDTVIAFLGLKQHGKALAYLPKELVKMLGREKHKAFRDENKDQARESINHVADEPMKKELLNYLNSL